MSKNINKTDDPKNDDSKIKILLTKEETNFLISQLIGFMDCVNSYYETKVSEKNASIAKKIFEKIFNFYEFNINW